MDTVMDIAGSACPEYPLLSFGSGNKIAEAESIWASQKRLFIPLASSSLVVLSSKTFLQIYELLKYITSDSPLPLVR